ncbi:hypothetical protein GCM10010234_78970 [Streptomyces hawaiiensis]|uniref:hypothetical protein n=1 Tax=Streptomyces hawaiiensis TaxID=67305 RepID=UPI0031DB8EEF
MSGPAGAARTVGPGGVPGAAGDGIGPDVAELAVVRAAGIEVPTTHAPVSAGLPTFQK